MSAEQASTTVDRKQASRRKLLDAARQLFIERGYHETRPQDVSRLAGVGHGTFYLHFADKRECFLAFVDEAAGELHAMVMARTIHATNLTEYLQGVFDGCVKYEEENPGVMAVATSDPSVIDPENERPFPSLNDRWAKEWADVLTKYRERGEIRTDISPCVMGHFIVGLCAQAWKASLRGEFGHEQLISNVISFITSALAPRTKA